MTALARLVVLFADLDAQALITPLILRGIERGCLRHVAPEFIRNPNCDPGVVQNPVESVRHCIRDASVCFLVVWDHQGSGKELCATGDVEVEVARAFERAGVDSARVAAIAFNPELETTLVPVWDNVLELISKQRGQLSSGISVDANDPKESLRSVLRHHKLRAGSQVFKEFGEKLPLSKLKKGDALGRVCSALSAWFGNSDLSVP